MSEPVGDPRFCQVGVLSGEGCSTARAAQRRTPCALNRGAVKAAELGVEVLTPETFAELVAELLA
ncbi:hypothetical protein ACFYNW_34230 [Streptomyces virginiae]|uniref:hypothetical protein n=1 Tax=Streptomyces virginiae TaxID=1961 RepID=UPI0036E215B9